MSIRQQLRGTTAGVTRDRPARHTWIKFRVRCTSIPNSSPMHVPQYEYLRTLAMNCDFSILYYGRAIVITLYIDELFHVTFNII